MPHIHRVVRHRITIVQSWSQDKRMRDFVKYVHEDDIWPVYSSHLSSALPKHVVIFFHHCFFSDRCQSCFRSFKALEAKK